MTVALRYAGDGAREVQRYYAYLDYAIIVRNTLGKALPRRTDRMVGAGWSAGSGTVLTLRSGQVQTEDIDLSALYKFNPGHYTLKAERVVRSNAGVRLGDPFSRRIALTVE